MQQDSNGSLVKEEEEDELILKRTLERKSPTSCLWRMCETQFTSKTKIKQGKRLSDSVCLPIRCSWTLDVCMQPIRVAYPRAHTDVWCQAWGFLTIWFLKQCFAFFLICLHTFIMASVSTHDSLVVLKPFQVKFPREHKETDVWKMHGRGFFFATSHKRGSFNSVTHSVVKNISFR